MHQQCYTPTIPLLRWKQWSYDTRQVDGHKRASLSSLSLLYALKPCNSWIDTSRETFSDIWNILVSVNTNAQHKEQVKYSVTPQYLESSTRCWTLSLLLPFTCIYTETSHSCGQLCRTSVTGTEQQLWRQQGQTCLWQFREPLGTHTHTHCAWENKTASTHPAHVNVWPNNA